MHIFALSLAVLLCVGAKDGLADDCGPAGPDPQGNCRDEPLPPIPVSRVTGTDFVSEPLGVEVRENGVRLGITPFRLSLVQLKPGTHVLELHREQYEPVKKRVVVSAGQLNRVTHKMIPLPAINIEAADAECAGARVTIDQRPVGTVPLRDLVVSVGPHTIKAEKEGYDTWSTGEIDFPSGSRPRDLKCILRPQFGTVTVGGGPGDLQGVTVWLDPESTETKATRSRVKGGVLLGQTPTAPTRIRSGKHIIALEIEGLTPISQVIMVPVDAPLYVPAQVDFPESESMFNRAWSGSDRPKLDEARAHCRKHRGLGCLVAGYAAMHEKPPKLEDAERYYREGCTKDSSVTCFALGYLEKKRKAPDADSHLKAACLAGSINACLARHLPIEQVPNPTNNPGDWEIFAEPRNRIEEKITSDSLLGTLGGMVAVGPANGTPVQLEGIGHFGGRFFPPFEVRFGLGLRFRLVRQRDAVTDDRSYGFSGGPGFDIGFRLLPKKHSTLMVQAMARFTAMLGAQSSISGLATIGYARSKRGVQLGVLVDKVPLVVQKVGAFGEERTIEDYSWQALLVAGFGFDGEVK